jgi:hypothetical protein
MGIVCRTPRARATGGARRALALCVALIGLVAGAAACGSGGAVTQDGESPPQGPVPSASATSTPTSAPSPTASSSEGSVSQDPLDYQGTWHDPNGGGATITGGTIDVYDVTIFSANAADIRLIGHMTESGLVAMATDSAMTVTFKAYDYSMDLHVETSRGYEADLTPL